MENNCFSGNDALSRALAWQKKNAPLFEARRARLRECNNYAADLAELAQKMFETSQRYGVPSVIEGRLKAYADVLSSMSGDLQGAID